MYQGTVYKGMQMTPTATSTQDISRVSILVTLAISTWDINRQDRKGSASAAESHKVTDQRMCRLRKTLIPRTPELKELESIVRATRTFHYDNTHAWMHDGPRILTRKNYDNYMQTMRDFKVRFEAAVLNFISQFDESKEAARKVLGDLYSEADYPSRDALYREYKFDTLVQPLPLSSSLLDLGLDSSESEALRLRLEQELTDTFTKANRRVFEDFEARLVKLHAKVSDPAAPVLPDTLNGVSKLAALLPRINLLGNEELDKLAAQVCYALDGVSADAVKTNSSVRGRLAYEIGLAIKTLEALKGSPHAGASRVLC